MIKWEQYEHKKDSLESDGPIFIQGFNQDPNTIPNEAFNIWFAHTDFNLFELPYTIDKIAAVDGVEIVRPVSRYMCVIGIAKTFDVVKVQEQIELALSLNENNRLMSLYRSYLNGNYPVWAILYDGQNDKFILVGKENGTLLAQYLYTHDSYQIMEQHDN